MAKEIFDRCWRYTTLCLLLSFVSKSHLMITTQVDVPITNEEKCGQMLSGEYPVRSLNRYSLRINLGPIFDCPSEKKGFKCGVTMSVADPFDAVGSRLCVDLDGVADSIPHSQFAIIVSDQSGEMQRVYTKSLRFDREPYNLQCAAISAQRLEIVLRALSTVKMCPDILPSLENHNTSLGTVYLKTEIPTHTLVVQDCSQLHREPFEEHSILKVIPGSGYRFGCAISLRPQVQYRQFKTCFKIEYMSRDFRCKVEVVVKEGMVEYLSFKLPNREEWDPSDRTAYCFNFEWPEPPGYTFPSLVIRSDIWECRGKFALDIKYERYSDGGGNDVGQKSSINRRNLYMAVFISVISVCIFIMGLTCLCCLRMRARSRQRSQASGRRATTNVGYDGNTMNGDSPAFWTSTSSDQVFGLPSYEEATLGSVPSSPGEAEKPPAYESLYVSESSLPSTSTSPPPRPEESGPVVPDQLGPSAPEG